MDQWDYDRFRARAEVKLKALRARKAAIEKRLEELGYESPDWIGVPEFEMAVNHTIPLTEAAWDKMYPKLLAALAPRRAHRETAEFNDNSRRIDTTSPSSRPPAPPTPGSAPSRTSSRPPSSTASARSSAPDTPLLPEHFAAIADTLREQAQPYLTTARADVARIFRPARAGELSGDSALEVDEGGDGAEEREAALLDVHDALFRCSSFPCSDYTRAAMTVSALLEHWQEGQPYEWNGAQRIWLADRAKRERVPVLIEALGLLEDTTISALEDAVADREGSPACRCRKAIEPAKNRYEVLDRLLCYLLPPQSLSDGPMRLKRPPPSSMSSLLNSLLVQRS